MDTGNKRENLRVASPEIYQLIYRETPPRCRLFYEGKDLAESFLYI